MIRALVTRVAWHALVAAGTATALFAWPIAAAAFRVGRPAEPPLPPATAPQRQTLPRRRREAAPPDGDLVSEYEMNARQVAGMAGEVEV